MSTGSLSGYQWPAGTVWPVQNPPAGTTANLADFGPQVATVDVDDAVIATLKTWLPTYLRFIERSRSLGFTIARPKSFASTVDPDQFVDNALPAVLVATARTQGNLQIAAGGNYITCWLVAVSAVVRGRTPPETRRSASWYELAARMALVQQGDLGGFARETRWVSGGEARPLADPNGKGRWLGEGASQFWVFTDAAVQADVGPNTPDQEPYQPLATVDTVDFELDAEPPGDAAP